MTARVSKKKGHRPTLCCKTLIGMSLEKRGGLAIDRGPEDYPGPKGQAGWFLIHDHWYGGWVEIKFCPFCGTELPAVKAAG